ncbi:hypothetical protein [Arthrobacter sp. NPDC058127]|uniref:hypothetical protein n=1 Tax=Arthrobacter sp. NPDC058127 TaxID=3346351 RepID=UPI0036E7683B
MRFEGVLPEDAPDPRIGHARRLELMPIPIIGLVPQPSLEDVDMVGFQYGQDTRGYSEMSASISYTLWRNPADRSDPVNLAELDGQGRQMVEGIPPWPRPRWLVEQAERLRYPQLWEAVRTTWRRDASELSVGRVLSDHLNHVLINRYRREWPGRKAWTGHAAEVTVRVDEVDVRGLAIDTDPLVYAVGASLGDNGVVTAVLPRNALGYLRIEFETRRQRL